LVGINRNGPEWRGMTPEQRERANWGENVANSGCCLVIALPILALILFIVYGFVRYFYFPWLPPHTGS
jgi:hypothetical protein